MSDKKPTRERDLETILTICVFFVLFFLIGKSHHRYFLILSLVIGLCGMFSRFLTAKISWAWWKLSELMGSVMSKVILSVIFFVFLVPIAFLSRIFSKKDDLQLRRSSGDTYYITRNHVYQATDLKNAW